MICDPAEYRQRRRRMTLRGVRYVILSLLLTAILLTATGCAALLMGDNKKAYDCLVKGSGDFYYPSSVQIVSGAMSGNSLYCQLRAKNRLGSYRYGTYWITSSGSVYESDSSTCYNRSSLDYDAINAALAEHYGTRSSSGSGFKFDFGGLPDMEEFIYLILCLAVIIGMILILGLLAGKASDMAQDKGYEKRFWFHMCFWLGPVPYLIICAMPDKVMQQKQDRTNRLLEELISAQKSSSAQTQQRRQEDVASYLPEL